MCFRSIRVSILLPHTVLRIFTATHQIADPEFRNDPKFSDRSGQTVQTQIILLLEEQSD